MACYRTVTIRWLSPRLSERRHARKQAAMAAMAAMRKAHAHQGAVAVVLQRGLGCGLFVTLRHAKLGFAASYMHGTFMYIMLGLRRS